MEIKLFDLITSVDFEFLLIGSCDDHITFSMSDFDFSKVKLFDKLHRNGWSDSIVNNFLIYVDGLGSLTLWVKEWSV